MDYHKDIYGKQEIVEKLTKLYKNTKTNLQYTYIQLKELRYKVLRSQNIRGVAKN